MVRAPLIIGIDPGTTSSYAILDINGNLVDTSSSKEFGLSNILREVIDKGIPILVGTDKAKVPELIQQFSAKTGARIVLPNYDLKVEEKRNMVIKYKYDNVHEMDSIASAIYAYNSYSALINKIKRYAELNNKKEILADIIILVIKEEISITDAAEYLDSRNEVKRIADKVILAKSQDKADFFKLYDQFKKVQKDNFLLRKYNSSLLKKNEILRFNVERLEKHREKRISMNSKKIDLLFSHKEKTLAELNKKIKQNDNEIKTFRKDIESFITILGNINSYYVFKKLDNLGINEFEQKNSLFGFKYGDFIFVKNINVYNIKVIENLKDKVSLVLYQDKITTRAFDDISLEIMPVKEISFKEFDNFVLVQREIIDMKLEKKKIFKDIIKEYKESRKI
jgi:uncharacterized protein